MADELMFLQLKASFEQLVESLSASSHTVASVPDAMNLLFLQFPMLDRYLQSPEVHVAASRNPELYREFFADIAEEQSTPRQAAPDVLGLDGIQAEQVAMLLSDTASPSPHRHIEAGGRIRHFRHACLVLQTPEGAVVTNPFIGVDCDVRNRYTLDDLPDFIDLVLVTHGHQDHIVLETLLQLRGRIGTIVAPRSSRGDSQDTSTGLYLSRLGFPVVEADDYDEFAFPGGRVVATPFLDESFRCDQWS